MLGQLALRQKELVKEIYDRGHTIGSHTYDHKNLKKLDKNVEIKRCKFDGIIFDEVNIKFGTLEHTIAYYKV